MRTDSGWPDFLANPGVFAQAFAAAAPHQQSFLNARFASDDLDAWLAETRPRFLDLLHYEPPRVDPSPEVVNQQDYGDFTRESIRISLAPWSRVTCELLIPKQPRDGQWPAPALVALHCHGGAYRWGREKIVEALDTGSENRVLRQHRELHYGGRGYANVLASRGYVVAVIDAFFFGDRRLRYAHGAWPEPNRQAEAQLEPDSEDWLVLHDQTHKELQARIAGALFQAGATWPGVFVSEDRRTIDYLQTRPEVDPDRIGCIGLSVGGLRSGFLAAADERIQAAVAVGWLCGLGDLWPVADWPYSVGWVHYVPGLYQELDIPDVAALACPRPLMVLQGRRDTLFPADGVERALERVSTVYGKAGMAERFQGRMFDVDHRFDVAMQDEAFDWLDRWL